MLSFLKLLFLYGEPSRIENYVNQVRHPESTQGGHGIVEKYKSQRPLVSIITVVRNGEKTLERTIQSVKEQTYESIEYIVIDGASKDTTLKIIRKHEESIDYWLSEPDNGIYDAFNKGVSACTGEFIGILNSDDWMSQDQISNAVKSFSDSGADFVHGDIYYHKKKGEKIFKCGDANYSEIIQKMMPQLYHTTMLCKSELFRKVGLFRTTFRIAGDYDWFIRVHSQGFKGVYEPQITGHMKIGGISTTFRRRAVLEGFIACVKNGYPLIPSMFNWGHWFVFIDGTPLWFVKLSKVIKKMDNLLNSKLFD
jgi:glycosyltransferase involved in cell wall biosynthesis